MFNHVQIQFIQCKEHRVVVGGVVQPTSKMRLDSLQVGWHGIQRRLVHENNAQVVNTKGMGKVWLLWCGVTYLASPDAGLGHFSSAPAPATATIGYSAASYGRVCACASVRVCACECATGMCMRMRMCVCEW